MENSKYVVLPVLLVSVFFIFQFNTALAYHAETHAYLTSETVEFYNKNFPDGEVPYELKNYLIDGSRREDDAPRWMNHFYDPVYDRGLSYDPQIDPEINLGNWQKSKDWAKDSENQNKLTYKVPATIASVLTAIQQKKISSLTSETDFTWGKAVEFYAKGEKEKAMFVLGHILHLIEDASVPDHARNDPHPGGSPYEEWTKQFSIDNPDNDLRGLLLSEKLVLLNDLGGFFNGLANYSNNNFYSEDTIGIQSGYSLPEINEVPQKINGRYFSVDNDGQPLFFYKKYNNSFIEFKNDISLVDPNDLIIKSYWSLLAPKSVQYSAGVINLFFKEAEAAKNDPNFKITEEKSFFSKSFNAVKGLFAQIGSAIDGLLNSGDDFELVEEISVNDADDESASNEKFESEKNNGKDGKTKKMPLSDSDEYVEEDEDAGVELKPEKEKSESQKKTDKKEKESENNPVKPIKPQPEPQIKQCSFSSLDIPSRQGVIINEVAWMGTTASANDEWIELKNISSANIDLDGWQLVDKDEKIKINFDDLGDSVVSPGGFVLLERTDDDSVQLISADLIYSGALSNSNEGLRLFNSQCGLIDEVLVSPNWPAGNSSDRKTMERDFSGFGWHDSSIINGTPKAENSVPAVYYGGGGGGSGTANPPTQNEESGNQVSAFAGKILISEIQAGIDENADDEFIELYNSTDGLIDLTGWELRKKSSSGSENNLVDSGVFTGSIPAKGFFLVTSPSYSGLKQADVIYSASSSDIAYLNNSIVLYDGDHSSAGIVDEISYKNIEKGESIERKAFVGNQCVSASGDGEFLGNGCDTGGAADFEARIIPNPQNSQSLPEPRSAPSASISDFNIVYSSSSMELVLDWKSSDAADSTSTLFYELKEYSSPGKIIFRSSTSTAFKKTIDEIGRDYDFSIQVTDVDGLGSEMVSSTIKVPSFLNSLSFYNSSSSGDVIEARYGGQHFIPDIFRNPQNSDWKLVVFYLNGDADKQKDIFEEWQPDDLVNVLSVEYEGCAGASVAGNSIIIPDIEERCGNSGGAYSQSIKFGNLEDNQFPVKVQNLSGDDRFNASAPEENYITAAFYSTYATMPYDGRVPYFRLVAVDKTKYYFGNKSRQEAPKIKGDLNISFDKPNSRLNIDWPKATDADTLDSLLTYEIRYSSSTEWASLIGSATGTIKSVNPGDSFLISVRAKDDFGNYSSSTTPINWSYPETIFHINQIETDGFSNSFGYQDGTGSKHIIFQSFTPKSNFSFDKAIFKIKHEQISDSASLRLSVYPDNGSGKPDFNNELGTTILGGLFGLDGTQDSTFSFSSPVSVIADSDYWLVFKVESYSWWNGYDRNKWQVAVSNLNPYIGGMSGGAMEQGENHHTFYYSGGADWYMKLGME